MNVEAGSITPPSTGVGWRRTDGMLIELTIARCRTFLSVFALLAVYVDPTRPTILPSLHLQGGPFTIGPHALAVLTTHLVLGIAVWAALAGRAVAAPVVAALTTWTDVIFAGLIAACTEGVSSPFYVFFVFAVTASGFRSGMRRTVVVIVASIVMYLSLLLVSGPDDMNFYIMRPVYLAVIGYLIAHLADRRVALERRVRGLEAEEERTRIASTLHDGSLQTLIAASLRLDGCRQLLREGRHDEALMDISALETEIVREYEGLRTYVRDLASVEGQARSRAAAADPRVSVDVRFAGPAALVDEVLQIAREAITNVRRHAAAHQATVCARRRDGHVEVSVDDDGVGFPPDVRRPWSIGSRVDSAGGRVWLEREAPGAHLRIDLPNVTQS